MYRYEMREEILNEWIEDLENNGHLQGRFCLRNIKGECCSLGRLCEIGVKKGIVKWNEKSFEYNGTSQRLPKEIVDWARMNHLSADLQLGLILKNDEYGWTFKQIAQWPRENVEPITV